VKNNYSENLKQNVFWVIVLQDRWRSANIFLLFLSFLLLCFLSASSSRLWQKTAPNAYGCYDLQRLAVTVGLRRNNIEATELDRSILLMRIPNIKRDTDSVQCAVPSVVESVRFQIMPRDNRTAILCPHPLNFQGRTILHKPWHLAYLRHVYMRTYIWLALRHVYMRM